MLAHNENVGGAADVVIPVYGEAPGAVAETVAACAGQTYPVWNIFVVDDGSPEAVSLPSWAASCPQIQLLRLKENQGISAARNAGIAVSRARLVACVNVEVLPAADWLQTCASYLLAHPNVGACYTRVVPKRPERLLTRWRMRFQEPRYGAESCATPFAHGHAVLFMKEALAVVGGYDVHYKRHHEDSDICQRMGKLGWESHYVAESHCVSAQMDSLTELAIKQLRDSGWYSPEESSLSRLYVHLSKWTLVRAGRNILKGRFYFLPVDFAIWALALSIATSRTLRSATKRKAGGP